MSSLAVKLPITRDTSDSYTMIDDFESLIKQNLKMLILTSQGERIMEPEFGVGIRNFLFENFNDQKIRKQTGMFMPAIKILEVGFAGSDLDRNLLGIQVFYSVPDIGITDLLEFTI